MNIKNILKEKWHHWAKSISLELLMHLPGIVVDCIRSSQMIDGKFKEVNEFPFESARYELLFTCEKGAFSIVKQSQNTLETYWVFSLNGKTIYQTINNENNSRALISLFEENQFEFMALSFSRLNDANLEWKEWRNDIIYQKLPFECKSFLYHGEIVNTIFEKVPSFVFEYNEYFYTLSLVSDDYWMFLKDEQVIFTLNAPLFKTISNFKFMDMYHDVNIYLEFFQNA
jgi:hypothetical protein